LAECRHADTVLAIPLFVLQAQDLGLVWLGLLAVLGLVPAIDAAVAVVNAV
jgi:hypothetical protein